MIDRGEGPPVVLVPGVQGRWEWMRPTVGALAERCRVITFTLCGDGGSGRRFDMSLGFDNFTSQIDAALDAAGVSAAAICGVSYGGWIALRYAAVRPSRTTALVLASTPSPRWQPEGRLARYVRAPRLYAPAFALGSPGRLSAEIAAACPRLGARLAFSIRHLARIVAAPCSPTRMARRIRLLAGVDLAAECSRVTAPALVVTGEASLDRVVPVASSREYLALIAGARAAVLERTGHIGVVTRPQAFAEIVAGFVRGELERLREAS